MDQPEISPDQVRQVAKLARIAVDDASLTVSADQLRNIVGYVDQLNEADIPDSVPPFFGAIDPVSVADNAVRADLSLESMDREEILRNSPDTDGEFYRVPPVF